MAAVLVCTLVLSLLPSFALADLFDGDENIPYCAANAKPTRLLKTAPAGNDQPVQPPLSAPRPTV